ncbi:uncharacterized protein LOC114719927, partial [Neltuma alba]|uniref:uncharacterized protein LOC114719927 n=1 Tax=Neltuma alba TaxID=207710 RepID=UPI0010A4541F
MSCEGVPQKTVGERETGNGLAVELRENGKEEECFKYEGWSNGIANKMGDFAVGTRERRRRAITKRQKQGAHTRFCSGQLTGFVLYPLVSFHGRGCRRVSFACDGRPEHLRNGRCHEVPSASYHSLPSPPPPQLLPSPPLSSPQDHTLLFPSPYLLSFPTLPLPSSPLKASDQLHNQAASSVRNGYFEDYSPGHHHSHPWPEWSKFIDHISASGYFDSPPCEGEFAAAGQLQTSFLREASACLAFARDRKNILRLLSRRDIEAVIEHGAPFLFQDAEDSVRKMRSFISNSTISVSAEFPFYFRMEVCVPGQATHQSWE